MAGKKSVENVENEVVTEVTEKKDDNARYPYRARINKQDEADIFVGVNGANKIIRRGDTVMLPSAYIEVLENSEDENDRAYKIELQKEAEYRQSVRDLTSWKQ